MAYKLAADMNLNLIYDWAINNFVLIYQLAESQTSSGGDELLGKTLIISPRWLLFGVNTKISNLHFSFRLILSQLR